MDKADLLLSTIEGAYAAALDPARWPDALRQIGTNLGGTGALFEVVDKSERSVDGYDSGLMGPKGLDRYRHYYYSINPRVRYSTRAPEGTIFYDRTIGTETELERNEYYADFLAPAGLRYFVSANIVNDSKQRVTLAVQRTRRQGHVGETEIGFLKRLLPHLQTAYRTGEGLQTHIARAASLAAALDGMDTPALLLGEHGSVAFVNTRAERLLTDETGLAITGGSLRARRSREQKALDAAIGRTLALRQGAAAAASLVRISRPGGAALLLRLVPLRPTGLAGEAAPDAAAILVLINPGVQLPRGADTALIELFGLTPTEAALAVDFARGADFKSLAAARSMSLNTVRWHFAGIRAKLGAHSQADIVRVILGRIATL